MKPTLLIVDDEKPTREGLRAALEDRYDVYIAEDAKAAMNLLERENFDVMLTDFRLPNEDGMKLIARAKSLSKPPICILMTAYGSEELAVEAMKRGADDYIAKGRLQIDELEMRIARALRSKSGDGKCFAAPAARRQVRPGKHRRRIAGDEGDF
jgi:two-component system, NtrC family, response regulator AtoC